MRQIEKKDQIDKRMRWSDESNWEKDQVNQIDQSVSQIKSVSSFFRDASVLISLYHDIISHVASEHVTHNRGHITYSTVAY